MYLEYVSSDNVSEAIVLADEEIKVLLMFLVDMQIEFNEELYCYSMNYEETCTISRMLDEEAAIALKVEKEFEYEVVLSKETFQHNDILLKLAEYFQVLIKSHSNEVTIYVSKDNLALNQVLEEKRAAAVKSQINVNNVVESSYYAQYIELPITVEKDFFEKVAFKPNWGIAYIQDREYLNKKNYIPLKGYEVQVETTSKLYFTGAVEITYTAFHIHRNSKDHRYSYKVKRAQKVERYLINENAAEKVYFKIEKEYAKRVEEASILIEEICKRAEENIEHLHNLNASIVEPFVKNQMYYVHLVDQVKDFLEKDYAAIVEAYFLMGIISLEEYEFHQMMQRRLQQMIEEIYLLQAAKDENNLLSKQAHLLRYFLENTEATPKAGLIRHHNKTYRALMQIEQERCYSEEFRSDDSLVEFYKTANK